MSDDLERRLREAANQLDHAAPSVTADEARHSRFARPPSRRGPLLLAAAAVAVVAGSFALANVDRESTTDIGPLQSTSTTSQPPTSTEPAATTTTVAPADSVWPPLDLTLLPPEGLAVTNPDGTTDLYDLSGNLLVTTETPAGTNNERQLVVSGSRLELPLHHGALEVPPGCTSAVTTVDGRLAICEDGRAIHRVDEFGNSAVFMDEPETNPEWTDGLHGRWTRLVPSPDGQQVMALWSGECEVPTTFLLGEGNRAAFQTTDKWWDSPETIPVGWIDGQPVVEVGHGLCGQGFETAGIYEVNELESTRVPIVAFDADPGQWASAWRIAPNGGNELETALAAAIESLGYDTCCGEDSHGGSGARTGVIHDGVEISIWADVAEILLRRTESGPESGNPDAAITIVRTDLGTGVGPVVTFSCEEYTFALDGTDSIRAVAVAEALVPRLGCTLVEPVLAEMGRWIAAANGGPDAAIGFGPEGHRFPILFGYGDQLPLAGFLTNTQTLPFVDDTAVLATLDNATVVAFGCGGYTISLASYPDEPVPPSATPASDATLLAAAEVLLAGLPCEQTAPLVR